MALDYDSVRGTLWAVCDNDCNGRTATLDIAASGKFEVTHVYARPAGMPDINNEGFAITPQSECRNGLKPVFYSDDDNTDLHALRTGSISCTPLPETDADPAQTPTPDPVLSTPQQTVVHTPAATTAPAANADRTAPRLTAAVKVRRTGKLTATITLGERADLTLTAKAGKRTLVKTTRKGVAAGKRTITLKVKHVRRGTKVKLTVQARDAAGNLSTRTASATVR
jgi:hypothetical protein